jgi:hypothetical protein
MSGLVENARRRAAKESGTGAQERKPAAAFRSEQSEAEKIAALQAQVAELTAQVAARTAERDDAMAEVRESRLKELEPLFAARREPFNPALPRVRAFLFCSSAEYRAALNLAFGGTTPRRNSGLVTNAKARTLTAN